MVYQLQHLFVSPDLERRFLSYSLYLDFISTHIVSNSDISSPVNVLNNKGFFDNLAKDIKRISNLSCTTRNIAVSFQLRKWFNEYEYE